MPGSSADPCPRGLERVEVRTSREWARVESEMNSRTRAEAQRVFEQDRQGFGSVKREMHADLRRMSRDFSPENRELADYALQKSQEKDSRRRPRDQGGWFAGRHFTEGHVREQNEQRMHESLRRKR